MTPALISVENIVVRNLSTVADANNANIVDVLNLVQAPGVQNVTLTNSTTLGSMNIINGSLNTVYAVNSTPAEAATAAGISVTINSVELTGKADTATFSASNAGSKVGAAAANAATLNVANTVGVESVSVNLSGTNYVTIDGAGNDTKTIVVTGSGTNEISTAGTDATLTIDASASTGTNTFLLTNTLTSADVVKGGSGTDTVSVTLSDATGVSFSGVEVLRVEQGSTNGANLAFAASTDVKLDVRDSDNAEVSSFTNLATTDIAFVGAAVGGASNGLGVTTNDVTFGTVRLNTAYAGANDSVAVSLGNQGVAAVNNYAATIQASGIENVSISQADTGVANTNDYTITNPGLKTVSVTSNSSVSLSLNTAASNAPGFSGTASTTSQSTVTLVDFSNVTGTAALTLGISKGTFAAAAEVKASQGGGSITFGEEAATDTITFTGNKGVDIVTTGAGGKFVANLGEGNDTFTAAGLSSSVGGSVTVSGGAGDDNITGSYAADVINGDAGSDIITGGLGADTMNGGDGSDTYVLAGGAAKANGTAQVTSVTPIGMAAGETLRVTIGGQTFEQAAVLDGGGAFSLDLTLEAFERWSRNLGHQYK